MVLQATSSMALQSSEVTDRIGMRKLFPQSKAEYPISVIEGEMSQHLQPTFESSIEQVARRICVRAPYFALHGIHFDGVLRSYAVAETASAGEVGPMTCCEVGRHGAIAGLYSVALARSDERRYYYLAQKADCLFYEDHAEYGSAIEFSARPTAIAARSAAASVEGRIEGRLVAKLDFTYSMIREDLFARMFAAHHRPVVSGRGDFRDYTPVRMIDRGEGMIDSLPEHSCAGHFEGYPALPAAVLMGQIVRIAGSLTPFKRFRVTRACMTAGSLAWAGESVRLQAIPTAQYGDEWEFECRAHVDERFIGSMKFGLMPA